MAPATMAAQPHVAHVPAKYRPMITDIGHQQEAARAPSSVRQFQARDMKARGQTPTQNQTGRLILPPVDVFSVRLAILMHSAGNTGRYAREEKAKNTFGTKASPTIRPIFRAPHPSNEDVDIGHPYLDNWKMPMFDKFSV